MVVAREGYTGIGLPSRLDATPGTPGADPRAFNADAVGVLLSPGFAAADIDRLHAEDIVPAPGNCRH